LTAQHVSRGIIAHYQPLSWLTAAGNDKRV